MLNRDLHKDALKVFRVIQRIMGDRERDRPVGVRVQPDSHVSTVTPINGHGSSAPSSSTVITTAPGLLNALLEEERWLLSEGLAHGELRDEIYCQIMKQVNRNPSPCVFLLAFQILSWLSRLINSFFCMCVCV